MPLSGLKDECWYFVICRLNAGNLCNSFSVNPTCACVRTVTGALQETMPLHITHAITFKFTYLITTSMATMWSFWWKINISSLHRPHNSSPKPVKLTRSGVHPALCLMDTKDSCGVQQPGCEVVHSPPSVVQVKNERSYTSTPPYAFMACTGTGVHSCHLKCL